MAYLSRLEEKASLIRHKRVIQLATQQEVTTASPCEQNINRKSDSTVMVYSAHNQEWSAEYQVLICKITSHIDSLSTTRHDQFYTDLLDEIALGPNGPRALSGELKKMLTVMSILIDQGKANNKTALHTHIKIVDAVLPQQVSWNPRETKLIEWYQINRHVLPSEPYQLSAGVYVSDPTKFYAQLDRGIENGCQGPRARTGALQDDLEKLKNKFEGSK